MTTDKSGFASLPKADAAPPFATWLPLVLVAVISLGSVLAIWAVRDDLPTQIARHWGADGRPDGFSSLGSVLTMTGLLSAIIPVVLIVLGRALKQARILGAFGVGMAGFLATTMVVGTWAQRGLTDASEAKDTVSLWIGLLAGAVLAGLTALVLRRSRVAVPPASGPLPDGAATLDVPASTRIAWTGRPRVDRTIWVFLGVAATPLVVMIVVFAALGNWSLAGFVALAFLAVAVLVSSVFARVSVDARGVRAVGLGVIPWVNLPLDAIQGATVVDGVSPLGDYGGYGLRTAFDGESEGLVTSEGSAMRITRAGRRPYLMTIADAAGAAATLNTLLMRQRG